MHKKLFIPGPTEVRKEILDAQSQWMIGHRTKDFGELYHRCVTKTAEALGTKHHVMWFSSSGTGCMEGAIRNTVDTKVLHCVGGAFAERWFKISGLCGKQATRIDVDWGKAVKPEMIDAELAKGGYCAVAITQNETSTGVRQPTEDIAKMMKDKYPDVLILVDAVSSLMGDWFEIDDLGLDVVVASSQKAVALPPGLGVSVVSPRAYEKSLTLADRGFYFNWEPMMKRYEKDHQTPTTPAISLFWALDLELDSILKETMKGRYERHLEMAKFTQEWVKKHFALFAEPGYESVTLTTADNNKGINVADLNKQLAEKGLQISNGYGKQLKEKTFRIAHMGDLTVDDMKEVTGAIEQILGL
ncbi:MAG: alanine--glyoxylate aminotransferase family protein [candidate division WOR-3 bacterium]|nr:MAG: alanine--glyoxylate aminotransferase family protein [candidate division WOR-3 bacterium]